MKLGLSCNSLFDTDSGRAWRARINAAGKTALCFSLALLFLATSATAAPFAKNIQFVQPDGTAIELWGQGDEFSAVFETLDGYTVIFDPAQKAYFYATLSADGSDLIPSSLEVGKGDPATFGLVKHLRKNPALTKKEAQERFQEWDKRMEVTKRWEELKARQQINDRPAAKAGLMKAAPPPESATTGNRTGLCILIDFDDDPATIPQGEIVKFCNDDNYTGFGNNGSIKQYFKDNSNNSLIYSNVVTVYIRIPNSLHPKSWYNDPTKNEGTQGNLLIKDAITIMKALPNYVTEILPTFADIDTDSSNSILCTNVFYAGGNGGVWAKGLWPSSWSLYEVGPQELSPGGKKVFRYQMTNIGTTLSISTFCHENGHMLCGFPDIYDYTYTSKGGAGVFCLMDYGGIGGNPVQFCAYLKREAGWATTTEMSSASTITATLTSAAGPNFNHFYRYQKPGVQTEYFLIENRQKAGRDANIAASGLAVWHIDELGNKDYSNLEYNSVHNNYEVTLVQADNLWHFERNVNAGDPWDLYYKGNTAITYTNRIDDNSAPNAYWWDGTQSGMLIKNISVSGPVMTFDTNTPFPGIDVQGNGVSIDNGSTTPSIENNTDFGTPPAAVTKTFIIYNIGDEDLSLTGTPKIAISGPNSSDFEVSTQPNSPIASGSSTSFQITFIATNLGVRTATVSIANNVSGKSPYTFAIQGQGTTDIALKGNAVLIANGSTTPSAANNTDFGALAKTWGSSTKTFTINNLGSLDLNLTGIPEIAISGTNPEDFIVTSTPTSPIEGGSSTSFDITFVPGDLGLRTATVSIANTVAEKNPYTFAIQGEGINPGIIQFRTPPDFNVNKYEVTAKFIVDRVGGNEGSASIRFSTSDGSAIAGKNYVAKSGILSWSPGFTAPQTFDVTLINDVIADGSKTFTLTLSNATGALLLPGEKDTVNVTILNNDYEITVSSHGPGTANPPGLTYVKALGTTNISAAPNPYSHFINWTSTGSVTIAAPNAENTSITYTGSGTVTANFARNTYPATAILTMAKNGNGIISPAEGSRTRNTNIQLPISATANVGNTFAGWSTTGNAEVQDPEAASTNVTVYGAATITANFVTGAVETLEADIPINSLTAIKGGMHMFKITVPATIITETGETPVTYLNITTGGGTGDCDLYARFAAAPTLTERHQPGGTSEYIVENYYAKSTNQGTAEAVSITNPSAGTWYIMVYGYESYSGVALLATFGTDVPETVTGFSILSGPPINTDRISMSWTAVINATGYEVWRSAVNDIGLATQLNTSTLNPEGIITATFYNDIFPVPGESVPGESVPGEYRYYYWVRAINAIGAGEFSSPVYGTNTDTGIIPLTNEKAVTPISGAAGTVKTYSITIPDAIQTLLEVSVSGGTGDCDIEVINPQGSVLRRSVHGSNNELLQIQAPISAGTWLINLYALTEYSNLALLAKYSKNAPNVPTGLAASRGLFEDMILLNWDAAPGASSYEVYRGLSSNPDNKANPATQIAEVSDNNYEDNDMNLDPDKTYYYSVKAKNGAVTSAFSRSYSGYLMKPLIAAASLSASNGKYFDKITVAWPKVADATSYELYRSPKALTKTITNARTDGDSCVITANAHGFVTGNTVFINEVNGTMSKLLNGKYFFITKINDNNFSVPLDTTGKTYLPAGTAIAIPVDPVAVIPYDNLISTYSYEDIAVISDPNPNPENTYHYWVKPLNGKSAGPLKMSAATGALKKTGPTKIQATNGTYAGQVKITWAAVPGATGYNVYRTEFTKVVPNPKPPHLNIEPVTETVYYDNTAAPGISYSYWVDADYNGLYQSNLSNGATGKVSTAHITALAAPIMKSASNGEGAFVKISWGAVPLATSYNVYRMNAVNQWDLLNAGIYGLAYTDLTAAANQPFKYSVRAVNGEIISPYSTGISGYAAAPLAAPVITIPPFYAFGFPGDIGNQKFYQILVPEGVTRLVAKAENVNGTCDLFAKLGMYPTTANYNAKGSGITGTADKVLAVTKPTQGSWYLLLYLYGAGTSGYSYADLYIDYYTSADIILEQVPVNDLPVPFTATFKGKVLDRGGAIAGLNLQVRNPITGITSWLPVKTDANGAFTYSVLLNAEGEHTFDFFFTEMPDTAKGTASHTVATRKGCLEPNNFFDFSAYLPATPTALVTTPQNDLLGMQTFLNIRNGWDEGDINPTYENMWINDTIVAAPTDPALLAKLDEGLYMFFYGVEGAGAGNDTTANSALSTVPFVVHVSSTSSTLSTVLSNLADLGIIDDTQKNAILSGKIGVVTVAALSNPTEGVSDGDKNISLIAREQLQILANLAAGNGTFFETRKYSDVITKKFSVELNGEARTLNVLTSAFVK